MRIRIAFRIKTRFIQHPRLQTCLMRQERCGRLRRDHTCGEFSAATHRQVSVGVLRQVEEDEVTREDAENVGPPGLSDDIANTTRFFALRQEVLAEACSRGLRHSVRCVRCQE